MAARWYMHVDTLVFPCHALELGLREAERRLDLRANIQEFVQNRLQSKLGLDVGRQYRRAVGRIDVPKNLGNRTFAAAGHAKKEHNDLPVIKHPQRVEHTPALYPEPELHLCHRQLDL